MLKKIKCLLVDDEFFALELMENYLNRTEGYEIVDKIRNPLIAYDVLRKEKIDILFLDIQMPHMTGISLLKNIEQKPITIFTTAYKQFAADAYDLDAIDYLQKPFTYERFCKALEKANQLLKVNQPATDGKLTIRADRKWINIPYDEILFIEGMREYVKVHTLTESYMALENMNTLEDTLPKEIFIRTHKSFIINKKHIKEVGNETLFILHHEIAIARNRKQEIKDLLQRK